MAENQMNLSEKPLREINQYRDDAFPVGVYVATRRRIVPEGRGYLDLHWHEEIQFTKVAAGTMRIQVNGIEYALSQGDIIFINSNALHITTEMSEKGRYVSLNFPAKILGFFPNSRMEQETVQPVTEDYTFTALVLRQENPWEQLIVRRFDEVVEIFLGEKEAHWQYEVSLKIAEIWYQMVANMKREDPSSSYRRTGLRKQERIMQMLTFVHTNYMNRIRVEDIAAAACVSEGECSRCFQEMLRESPMQYLLHYRYLRAVELLANTEMSVTEIAMAVGFNAVSYFIQYFKKQTDMTPREYRLKLESDESDM